MLYNTGTRLELVQALRLMQFCLMPDGTSLREPLQQAYRAR